MGLTAVAVELMVTLPLETGATRPASEETYLRVSRGVPTRASVALGKIFGRMTDKIKEPGGKKRRT